MYKFSDYFQDFIFILLIPITLPVFLVGTLCAVITQAFKAGWHNLD